MVRYYMVMVQDDVVCSTFILCSSMSGFESTSLLLSSFADFGIKKLFELMYYYR
jgi:hypothetical protein